jgi:restriction system protein
VSATDTPETESLEELSPTATAKAEASITFEQAEEQAWNEIESYLRAMPPYELQDLVSDLLKALRYHIDGYPRPERTAG